MKDGCAYEPSVEGIKAEQLHGRVPKVEPMTPT